MSADLAEVFAGAGCRGSLCVQADGSAGEVAGEVALHADEPVVSASVFKVLVALAAETAFVAGRLDPLRRVRLPAASRTPGPTGFSLFRDDVDVSARDLVPAMLTISDNVATDALLDLVGVETCNALAVDLGLAGTVVVEPLAAMIASIARVAGFDDWDGFTAWQASDPPPAERDLVDRRVRACSALTPISATRTTARDMCVLLRAIWLDRAGPPAACRQVRSTMARQLTRNRLAAAFPPPAQVAAKSGGLLGIVRNEVGVVSEPDGRRLYLAVFTEAGPATSEVRVNAAIAEAAATAALELGP